MWWLLWITLAVVAVVVLVVIGGLALIAGLGALIRYAEGEDL